MNPKPKTWIQAASGDARPYCTEQCPCSFALPHNVCTLHCACHTWWQALAETPWLMSDTAVLVALPKTHWLDYVNQRLVLPPSLLDVQLTDSVYLWAGVC